MKKLSMDMPASKRRPRTKPQDPAGSAASRWPSVISKTRHKCLMRLAGFKNQVAVIGKSRTYRNSAFDGSLAWHSVCPFHVLELCHFCSASMEHELHSSRHLVSRNSADKLDKLPRFDASVLGQSGRAAGGRPRHFVKSSFRGQRSGHYETRLAGFVLTSSHRQPQQVSIT